AVPQAVIRLDPERLVPFALVCREQFHMTLDAEAAVDLHAAPAVVVAEIAADTGRREAGLGRRHLPLIVARRQIVELAPEEQLRRRKQRLLEAEGIPRRVGRKLERQMARDERVVEIFVIEDRGAESQRRDEAVDRSKPVLAIAEVGNELEASCRLAQIDDQHALAAAVDQVEGSAA